MKEPTKKLYALRDQVIAMQDPTLMEEKKTEGGLITPAGARIGNWRSGVVISSGIDGIAPGDNIFWGGDPYLFEWEGEEYVSLLEIEVRAVEREPKAVKTPGAFTRVGR